MALFRYSLFISLVALLLGGCGGGGGGGGNPPPMTPPPTTPPPMTPPPANTTSYATDLVVEEAISNIGSNAVTGSASADLELNEDDNSLSGTVTLVGVEADAVSINLGFAGETGTEVIALSSDSASSWSIPSDTVLTDDERDSLEGAQFFVRVETTAPAGGVLRGQIIPNGFALIITSLSEAQSIPPTGSNARARGFTTINEANGDLTVRVVTTSYPDATIAHIHQALAGQTGDVIFTLIQDTNDTSLWVNQDPDASLNDDGMTALSGGEFYFNFHSDAFQAGEIRGQIVPDGVEVSFTQMSGDDVVIAGMTGVTTTATAIAASTLNSASMVMTTHINTIDLDDADSASANQAPAGQNGPSIFDSVQDVDTLSRWSAQNIQLSAAQFAALRNRGIYFTVTTPTEPSGEVRGQLIPQNSMDGNTDSFQVSSSNPADAAELEALPDSVIITFNRDLLAGSLDMNTVTLTASGGDGMFGQANDVAISGPSSSVSGSTLTIDLSGITVEDDIFQIAIADNQLSDSSGVILDGDNDGEAGGIFTTTFNVVTPDTPENPDATFSAIQQNIFSARCTICHNTGAQPKGLSLSVGEAYNEIVNVPSTDRPALFRIDPGNPDDSYLIRKLEGGPDISGGQMPLGGTPISQELRDNIREWVSNGALNN